MLTLAQEKWIAHLSDETKIKIVPFDPSSVEKFEKIKAKIWSVFGNKINVYHCGATNLGISGQDEIDVYIPVPKQSFNSLITPLADLFGPPASHYPLERARFKTFIDEKHIDVFLINETSSGWINGVKFEKYLRSHPKALESYRVLKEKGNGLSTREYYRRKIEFINDILAKENNSKYFISSKLCTCYTNFLAIV